MNNFMNDFMCKDIFSINGGSDDRSAEVFILLIGSHPLDDQNGTLSIGFPREGTEVECIHGGINPQWEIIRLQILSLQLIFCEQLVSVPSGVVATEIECNMDTEDWLILKALWGKELEWRADRLRDSAESK